MTGSTKDDTSSSGASIDRDAAIAEMSILLPREAAMLVRLVFQQVESDVTRPMAGILKTLSDRPMRITELAEEESLAQPTATALVVQAERRGWVQRNRDPSDGRVVIVSITAPGRAARRQLHTAIRRLLRERTAALSDDQVLDMLEATRILATLLATFRA